MHFAAILSYKRKHVFIDDFEPLPQIGDGLQGLRGDSDIIELNELCNFNKSIANSFFVADLADGINDGVANLIIVADKMGNNWLELESAVLP